MTACASYPQLKDHDPSGTRLRTLTFTLDPGDSFLPATTLVPVDKLDAEIVGGDLTVEVLGMGLISASSAGDVWGINFKLHGGATRVGETPLPLIRLRPYLASQPTEPAYDQTYSVAIRQT